MEQFNFSSIRSFTSQGKIRSISGTTIIAEIPFASLGDIVSIETSTDPVLAQVVSFDEGQVALAPLGETKSLSPGAKVSSIQTENSIYISSSMVGSLVDAFGTTLESTTDNKIRKISSAKNFLTDSFYSLHQAPKPVLDRRPVTQALETGVRSLDSFVTLGKGQRIVILAEPGVGKSSLLLSLAEQVQVDLVVVALIGERGREVTEFYEEVKNSEASNRTILVNSTSDQPAPVRAQAAETAVRIAEVAADQGAHVLLAFDSLTRYLRSLRDMGLSAGELPIRRGYPASVFEKIPKLIERAGSFRKGSITGVYTMLSTSELDEDPLVEEVKGLTDGHIVLRKNLAEKGHFPAIDIRSSLSRLQKRFWNEEELKKIQEIKARYSEYLDSRDLLVVAGNNDLLQAKDNDLEKINQFIIQSSTSSTSMEELKIMLDKLYREIAQY